MSADQHDLVLERMLDAPRNLVWRAWSDPELLNKNISPATAKRLNATHVDEADEQSPFLAEGLTGNKEIKDEVQKPRLLPSPDAGTPARPRGVQREAKDDDVEVDRTVLPPGAGAGSTPLPTGFPGRAALMKAGYTTVEQVQSADDEQLEAVDGIGEGTVKKIREHQK